MTRYLFITLTNIGRFFRNFLLLNSAAKLQRNFCRIYRRTVNMSLQPSVKLRSDIFKFYRFPFHCWACHSKSKLGWTDLILVDHGVEHWKSLQMTRLFVESVCDAWDIYLSEGQYCTPVHPYILSTNKKAQLTLSNPRDAKACKNWSHSSLKQVTV